MTGFASTVLELQLPDGNKASLSMTLKSLNSRFFEGTCKLPYALQSLEIEMMKLFKDVLYRGKVTFNIAMNNPSVFKGPVEPATHIIKSYIEAVNHIKNTFKLPGALTLAELLSLPNVFSEEEISIDETAKQRIIRVVTELVNEVVRTQEVEGSSLQKDIEERCKALNQEINLIEKDAMTLFEQRKNTIATKLVELDQQTPEITELKRNQLYYDLERMDIHEEIVRFKSHLQALTTTINARDIEKGRRIDFTLQELMREINTIAAKCSDASISAHAITIKVELEKIREQAQNIV